MLSPWEFLDCSTRNRGSGFVHGEGGKERAGDSHHSSPVSITPTGSGGGDGGRVVERGGLSEETGDEWGQRGGLSEERREKA